MDPSIIAAIISAIGAAVGGSMAPNPYQKKNSFGDSTGISARSWLTDLHNLLGIVTPGAVGRAISPVDLSNTMPSGDSLPSFQGGGLPMRIGASSSQRPVNPAASQSQLEQPVTRLPQFSRDDVGGGWSTSDTSSPDSPSGPRRILNVGGGGSGDWTTFGSQGSGGGSRTQATGAAQLLLHALTMGRQPQQQRQAA